MSIRDEMQGVDGYVVRIRDLEGQLSNIARAVECDNCPGDERITIGKCVARGDCGCCYGPAVRCMYPYMTDRANYGAKDYNAARFSASSLGEDTKTLLSDLQIATREPWPTPYPSWPLHMLRRCQQKLQYLLQAKTDAFEYADGAYTDLKNSIEDLNETRRQLRLYGQHKMVCSVWGPPLRCNCGFEKAIRTTDTPLFRTGGTK